MSISFLQMDILTQIPTYITVCWPMTGRYKPIEKFNDSISKPETKNACHRIRLISLPMMMIG